MKNIITIIFSGLVAVMFGLGSAALADVAPADYREKLSDEAWENNIRPAVFSDQTIIADQKQDVLQVKAPYTAEDASVVPISVYTKITQSPNRYIKKMHIFVDKNPVPLVGVFEFSQQQNGRADLAMRIRVDTFSYVRAVAELNTGELYMSKSFVRAKGACSAPPPSATLAESQKLLGKMKIKTFGELELDKPNLLQIKIRHPNLTGLAPIKIGSHVKPPAYFVREVVAEYNGKVLLTAQLTFSVSMDPAFRFYFVPDKPGSITVKALDTKNQAFSQTQEIL